MPDFFVRIDQFLLFEYYQKLVILIEIKLGQKLYIEIN